MDIGIIKKFLEQADRVMTENKEYLIGLDSMVGDGDLGLTMSDGFKAAYAAAKSSEEKDVGKVLYQAGKAMSTAVPSTMGTLMASGLMQAGKELRGKEIIEDMDIAALFWAYADGVMKRGGACEGDKTFLDGLLPAARCLEEALNRGDGLKQAAQKAALMAEQGFQNTTTMVAVHGRAATRGEASRTLEDPGAAVAMLLMKAFSMSL